MPAGTNSEDDSASRAWRGVPWIVTDLRVLPEYRVLVRFVDGTEGEVDISPLVLSERPGVFAPLRDPAFFARAYLADGVVTWPGNLDLAPDAMYDDIRARVEPFPLDTVYPNPTREDDSRGNAMVAPSAFDYPIVLPSLSEQQHDVPEVSRFFGIVISMYFGEHGPPHFHARYGEYWASIEVESEVIRGKFPRRARKLVLEWAHLHRRELLENWHRARAEDELIPIPPLE